MNLVLSVEMWLMLDCWKSCLEYSSNSNMQIPPPAPAGKWFVPFHGLGAAKVYLGLSSTTMLESSGVEYEARSDAAQPGPAPKANNATNPTKCNSRHGV